MRIDHDMSSGYRLRKSSSWLACFFGSLSIGLEYKWPTLSLVCNENQFELGDQFDQFVETQAFKTLMEVLHPDGSDSDCEKCGCYCFGLAELLVLLPADIPAIAAERAA